MKEKRRLFILAVMACSCPLVMQAQEVKSVSLDSIPKASLPKEGMSLEYSRPSLGGFPVLQGKSYYSESNAPWMSEEGNLWRLRRMQYLIFSSFPEFGYDGGLFFGY